jgi:hypothetical protein
MAFEHGSVHHRQMRRLLIVAVSCALGSCSEDDSAVAGAAGTSSGGASASGGNAAAAGASGGAGGGGGTSCNADLPVAATHAGLNVDRPIAPVAAVKHDLALAHSAKLSGYAVAHVTALDGVSGLALELVAARPNASTLELGAAIRVTDAAAPDSSNAGWPSIAATDDGSQLLVVWGDDRQAGGVGPIEILGQFFDASPSGLVKRGQNFLISTQPATNDWRPRAIFAPGADRFWVAWADDRNFDSLPGGRHLYARSVGLDGSLGAELELADGAPWQDGVHGAAAAGRVLFVWGQLRETADPIVVQHRARFVDAVSEQPVGEPFTLFERASVTPAPAAIAWDAERCRYLVAWQESDNRQIWGNLLDPSGSTIRAAFQITSESAGAGSPHLAWSSATRSFLLAYGTWESSEAYVVELAGDGTPLGPARSMHAAPPTNGTYFQDIAAGDGHALAISNEDYATIEGALLSISSGP